MPNCTLGVGCEETGVCFAEAHGNMDQCGRLGDSQAQRIQKIGLGAWLDEPLDLNEFYGYPPNLFKRLWAWVTTKRSSK